MGREEDILTAIDELDGFSFQKFARRLLQRELYPNLNPLPEQNDLGQDARTEELPVTDLPDLQQEPEQITFAISKTTTKQKVTDDCDSCQENDLDVETFAFVTSGEVSNQRRTNWEETVETDYGWNLIIYDRTWFADIATKPAHEKLVEEVLGVPPLHGDYHDDIVEAFSQVSNDTLSRIEATLPHIDYHVDREEIAIVLNQVTEGQNILLTGDAGVGKSGVLGQVVDRWMSSPVLFIDARRFSEVSTQTELRQEFDLNGLLSDAIARVGRHNGCLIVVDQLDNIGGTPSASLFADLLTDATDLDNVSVVAACRDWDLNNRDVYSPLTEPDTFTRIELSSVSEQTVHAVLDQLGITDYSRELTALGSNLLNLSIIAELHAPTAPEQIDYTQIKSQVELWDRYQETLVERETQGAEWDRESGYEVRARAVELAERGLAEGSRVVPISLRHDRADERLISRSVLKHERGERYRFRHDELQDYFYAWYAVNHHGWTTPRPVLEEINEHVAAGVFRWMLQMLIEEDSELAQEFLNDALAPDGLGYYAATTIIDEIRSWNPETQRDDLLNHAVDRFEEREELCTYFYTNLSNPAWVAHLHQQDRFEDPNGPLLTYLDRVAIETPGLVTDIIDTTQAQDERTHAHFLRIAESLPAEHATANIDQFQDWLLDATIQTGSYTVHYTDLITTLLEKDEQDAALSLLRTLLQPQDPDPKILEHETEDGETVTQKLNAEATALASIHSIETSIQDTWEHLSADHREDLLEILEEQLRTAITLESTEHDVAPTDIRWPVDITGSNINNIRLKEVLLQELRNGLEEWIGDNPDSEARRHWVERYLDDILLFRRLGLHLLRIDVDTYSDHIRNELLDEANYDCFGIRTEFFRLLQDGFPTLDHSDQQTVLQIIEEGPDENELQDLAEEKHDRFPDRSVDRIVQDEQALWKLRRFWMIQDNLPESYAEEVADLVEQYGEPDSPEAPFSSEGGAVSLVGPMDIEELRELSPPELLKLCVTWDPEDKDEDDFLTEVSPRGLAKDLTKLVTESPTEFVPHLPILTDADAIYLYHVFDALKSAIEEEQYFEWNPVLALCREATNRFNENWAAETRKKTCRLLQTGLADHDSGLVGQHAEEVQEILLTLSDDPDPGLDDQTEPEFIAHDDPIHTAINSVRPTAVNVLIVYALESAKHDGFEGSESERSSGLEDRVKERLIDQLNDPSTAVHSVFGQRLLNLRWLDISFVDNYLDTIFPHDTNHESRERFAAAWAAYLSVNQWYIDVYELLRDHYVYAIDLYAEEDRFTTDNLNNRFVAHILCSHLHTDETLGDDESLLTRFYEKGSSELAGQGAWQLWRWANDDPEFRERWPLVRDLWEWRLEQVTDDFDSHSREFQWYTEWLDLVGDRIDPDGLEEVLLETMPYVVQQRRSWETLEAYLAETVTDSPLTSIQIYQELVDQPDWPNYLDFGEDTWTILETALEAGGQPKECARDAAEEIAIRDSAYLDLLQEHNIE